MQRETKFRISEVVYRELKGHIVVRIPARRSQFPACASHADRSSGGSHIMYIFLFAIYDMLYTICDFVRVLSDYPSRVTRHGSLDRCTEISDTPAPLSM